MAGTIDSFSYGKNVLSYAKYFHCFCHATWLPCKTSIVFFHLRGCLHDIGATFIPARVHSDSLLWLCIRLHDTNTKCHAGAGHCDRREFTPVPSYGSVFVYMILTQNVMPARVIPARVIPARVHPGPYAGARFSSRHENSFRCHVNGVWLFVSYLLKFHQFYGTIRLAPKRTRLYVNTVQLFISPRNESPAVIM